MNLKGWPSRKLEMLLCNWRCGSKRKTSSCSMEGRVQGDKKRFFVPAKQPWRGWHKGYFTCCWCHIKRCDWSSDIFPRHGCLCPGAKMLFKPMQEHLVHHRDREEPSRNPASSNLSSFRPSESGCSTSLPCLKWSRQHWLFFRKRQGNMLESFHGCWRWNHRLSFSARGNIINSQWWNSGSNREVGVPVLPTQNRDVFSEWSEMVAISKATSSVRKASPNPGSSMTSHLKSPSSGFSLE